VERRQYRESLLRLDVESSKRKSIEVLIVDDPIRDPVSCPLVQRLATGGRDVDIDNGLIAPEPRLRQKTRRRELTKSLFDAREP
jgi:hypothetical protein